MAAKRIVIAVALLSTACAHGTRAPAPAEEPEVIPVCSRSAAELAGIVNDEGHRFAVCAELVDPGAGQHEYVLAFVATPAGRAQSITLLRADLEPVDGPVAACFAAVVESVGLARSGSFECPVTVPLVVPSEAMAGNSKPGPVTSRRDVDGWLVSSLKSAPAWPHD